jgi:CBS-domain-containing membrane protein
MTTDVATCKARDSLAEAARIMGARGVGSVVVLDDEGKLAGILTARDVCVAVARAGAGGPRMLAREAMTRPVFSCGEQDTVDDAIDLMVEHGVEHLPVLDAGGGLCGVVSLHDVAREAAQQVRLVGRGERRSRDVRWSDVGRVLEAVLDRWAARRASPATPVPAPP